MPAVFNCQGTVHQRSGAIEYGILRSNGNITVPGSNAASEPVAFTYFERRLIIKRDIPHVVADASTGGIAFS
ncbi:Uncharacterised protein [Escherichia coli]|nr:Uncharacterised protein [Escherichia coli]